MFLDSLVPPIGGSLLGPSPVFTSVTTVAAAAAAFAAAYCVVVLVLVRIGFLLPLQTSYRVFL